MTSDSRVSLDETPQGDWKLSMSGETYSVRGTFGSLQEIEQMLAAGLAHVQNVKRLREAIDGERVDRSWV